MDNTFIQEKLIPRLTFNPGLALTGFRTTRPLYEFIIYAMWQRVRADNLTVCYRKSYFDNVMTEFMINSKTDA